MMFAWRSVLPRYILSRRCCTLVGLVDKISRPAELGSFERGLFAPRRIFVHRPNNHGRFFSSKSSEEGKHGQVLKDLMESEEQPRTQITVGAKVAQAGKDISYFGIILIGFAVTGALLWFVVSELFFGFSANKVYASALKKVKANAEGKGVNPKLVVEAVGEPIMGHGETTSRGRRRHVSYQEYLVDGENYMRVKFYLSGSKRKGTVHVDVKQASRGNFDYRFILVELTGSPHETIIVLDNR